MSVSPPIRRLSASSSSREDLIYQYEAEEERIINILSRKLEQVSHFLVFPPVPLTRPLRSQLREEKIELENVLEAESESHVNRLSRELSALRLAQQQQQQQAGSSHLNGSGSASPQDLRTTAQLAHILSRSNGDPTSDMIFDALRRENEALRTRLVETEQDFVRISRLNEIYREELIQHRRRVSITVFPCPFVLGYSPPTARASCRQSHRLAASRPPLSANPPSGELHLLFPF